MIHDMVVNRLVSDKENEEELSSMMREILKELGK